MESEHEIQKLIFRKKNESKFARQKRSFAKIDLKESKTKKIPRKNFDVKKPHKQKKNNNICTND